MDSLRPIISNLAIYKPKNTLTNNLDSSNIVFINNISNDVSCISNSNYQEEQSIINNKKSNTKRYQIPTKNEILRKKYNKDKINRINSSKYDERQKYINEHSHYLYNPDSNYIQQNKSCIKQKQLENMILKLKKENEALKLLLKNKSDVYSYVPSRLYNPKSSSDIIKQQQNSIKIYNRNNQIKYNKKQDIILPEISSDETLKKELENMPILHKNFGKVPKYIEKMKEEYNIKKIEEERKEREKLLPKGAKYMDEYEKKNRIEELESMKRDLEYELFKMPITRLTYRMKLRKAEIEKSLDNVDSELNKLSYKDVIIHNRIG